MFPSLADRRRIPELMDDPALDPAEHRRALEGLARINRWSGSAGVLWPVVKEISRRKGGHVVRVLDVATGAGDVPIALWRSARRAKLRIELSGCDISRTSIDHATERAAKESADLRFFLHDALHEPLPQRYDLIVCSLFLHHLSEMEASSLLQNLRDAADAVAINDLARSRMNYVLVWIASHLLSRSRIVHFDGPASVRSAFTPAEAQNLAGQAGLANATVATRFPCRFLLTWR